MLQSFGFEVEWPGAKSFGSAQGVQRGAARCTQLPGPVTAAAEKAVAGFGPTAFLTSVGFVEGANFGCAVLWQRKSAVLL